MERMNEWFFGVVALFLLVSHEMLLTTAQREIGWRGDYPGEGRKASGGAYPGEGSVSKEAASGGGDDPGEARSGSRKAPGDDYSAGGEGPGADGEGKTPSVDDGGTPEKGTGSTPTDDYSSVTPPTPVAGTPSAPAAGTPPPAPVAVTPPAPVVGGMKSDCLAQSRLFHGMCFSSNNCAGVCVNEGFTDGKCEGFRRRCFCKKACDEASGSGSEGKTPPTGTGGTPVAPAVVIPQAPPVGGTPATPAVVIPPAPVGGTPAAPAVGTPPAPAAGTPPAGGLKSDCLAQSRLFHGMCFSSHNCAGVCVNEGFTDGQCKGFRHRCFCKKAC